MSSAETRSLRIGRRLGAPGWSVAALALVLAGAACVGGRSPETATRRPLDVRFAPLVERLSEPGGYFDTDNLISNERSYLHVVGGRADRGLAGGAYIGVGPDQNFSYIAAVRPAVAFIVDIRRDNLLQHLLFKALFARARNRLEYLCLLHGRPIPEDLDAWGGRPVDDLVAYIDATPATAGAARAATDSILATVHGFGVPLSPQDVTTIRRFHETFITVGLDLRFQSFGRGPLPHYPTLRQLVLETDRRGQRAGYLADEGAFRFVQDLQARDLVIPVVGDFAGDHALAAIGELLTRWGLGVSAFYTSNVEFYLMRSGTFDRFAATLAALPRADRSVIIRSYFGRNFGFVHPQAVPGYFSVQLLQPLDAFVARQGAGGYRRYLDLVTHETVDLR